MEGLLGFILAGFALAGSPGPATLSLAATGAAFGSRHGLAYMVGIDFGMVLVMAITASGVTGVLLALPGATPVVATLAALYFVYLAWRIATAPPLTENAGERREPSFAAWGDIPTAGLLIGSAIAIASGMYLFWRESRRMPVEEPDT
jgi:threonine/homoserine/homoserine lactone efflux protein